MNILNLLNLLNLAIFVRLLTGKQNTGKITALEEQIRQLREQLTRIENLKPL